MDNQWAYELIWEKGNLRCPFCGKPFQKWDFQVVREDDCQHDLVDIFRAYYTAINVLTDIYHGHRDSGHSEEFGEACFESAEEALVNIQVLTGLDLL